ncbi:MAG: hypothetical protein K6G83_10410 [Lachnospiraceae bacterium]|nr:hypothetical protein [Lachnospiraceae bacterium]
MLGKKAVLKDHLYTEEFIPLFRDADADGRLGVRGYFNIFQDVNATYRHAYGIGNDTLPKKTGCAWLFTKYKLHIYQKADFSVPVRVETWMEPVRSPLLVNHGLLVYAGDTLSAAGRLESCLFHLGKQRLERLSRIDLDKEAFYDREDGLSRFARIGTTLPEKELRYTHTVCYTDLDVSRHMNNIKYIDMFLNAFSREWFQNHMITEVEVQYRMQCFEGERLRVFAGKWDKEKVPGDEKLMLQALKDDDTVAATALLTIE